MANFQFPIQSAWGQNIKANAGAKIYFYEAGTLIPKVTYSDSAETIPLPHPVVADADGRFPAIFFSGSYKVTLNDADDVLIWTADNIFNISEDVIFRGDFDSSTNGGDYPTGGKKGDLYRVSTGFVLNPASGSHRLFTGDFIIANKTPALGIDGDWDTIKGTKEWLDEDDMISNSSVLASSQQAIINYVGISTWYTTVTYAVGDTVWSPDDHKLYKAKLSQSGNNPVGDTTNWEPANLIDDLVTDDNTQGLTAAQGKVIGDQLIPATKTTIGFSYLDHQKIILSNNVAVPATNIDHSGGRFVFDDGSGEAVAPAYTKQLNVAWASGNNQGGLDPSSSFSANGTLHCYAVYNPTSGLRDYVYTDTPGVVTVPGYTKKERRGSVLIDSGSNIRLFRQYKNYFELQDIISDISFTGQIPELRTITTFTLPIGFKVLAVLNILWTLSAGVALNTALRFTDPDNLDDPPIEILPNPIFDLLIIQQTGFPTRSNTARVRFPTNNLGQIGIRSEGPGAGPVTTLLIDTAGWVDYLLED